MLGNNEDDNSVSVPGAAVATAGVVLLIITVLLFVVVLFYWKRKKSKKACNIRQHTHKIAGLSHCYHGTEGALSRKPKSEPICRLEAVNGAYISAKEKSLDSLSRQHNHSNSVSNTAGDNVIIIPNPSYGVNLNASQTKKEPEQLEYDYASCDLISASAASGGVCGKANDSAIDDSVKITPNPSYSLPYNGQDVILEASGYY